MGNLVLLYKIETDEYIFEEFIEEV